jgi:hypothetical protein
MELYIEIESKCWNESILHPLDVIGNVSVSGKKF